MQASARGSALGAWLRYGRRLFARVSSASTRAISSRPYLPRAFASLRIVVSDGCFPPSSKMLMSRQNACRGKAVGRTKRTFSWPAVVPNAEFVPASQRRPIAALPRRLLPAPSVPRARGDERPGARWWRAVPTAGSRRPSWPRPSARGCAVPCLRGRRYRCSPDRRLRHCWSGWPSCNDPCHPP